MCLKGGLGWLKFYKRMLTALLKMHNTNTLQNYTLFRNKFVIIKKYISVLDKQQYVLSFQVDFKRYVYYGSGLLSEIDRYPEREKSLPIKSVKKRHVKEETSKSPLYPPEILEDISVIIVTCFCRFLTIFFKDEPCIGLSLDNVIDFQNLDEDSNINSDFGQPLSQSSQQTSTSHVSNKKKVKRFKDEESRKKWEEMMKMKRKKIFANMAKKEIGKQHRAKLNKHKEMLIQCRRVAQQCLKYGRQKAVSINKHPWCLKFYLNSLFCTDFQEIILVEFTKTIIYSNRF